MELTTEQRETYLEALRQGKTEDIAAREAHESLTGTIFRRLRRRDAAFAAEYEDAKREGQEEYAEQIRQAIKSRAIDPDEKSTRLLEMEAATHLDEYVWLRRKGSAGPVREQHMLEAVPIVNTDNLTDGQLKLLVELIEMGQGKRPNPELEQSRQQALGSGS